MNHLRTLLAALAVGLVPLPPAVAQSVEDIPSLQLFGRQMDGKYTYERLLKQAIKDFADLSVGDDAIIASDFDEHETAHTASFLARQATEIMERDLDRDGFVTEAEVRDAVAFEERERSPDARISVAESQEREVKEWSLRDQDGDGRVGWMEASALPPPGSQDARVLAVTAERRAETMRHVFGLDADGDGQVTWPEYFGAAEALFRNVDANSDNAISNEEERNFERNPAAFVSEEARAAALAVLRAREEQARLARARGEVVEELTCAMPAASPDAEVVGVGLQYLTALSNLAIGTQDVAVHVGRLVVAPGDTPVYAVLSSGDAVIWQVSGAVERLEHLVLHTVRSTMASPSGPQAPLLGATGIPAERVTFLGRPDCFRILTEVPSVEVAVAAARIREHSGREPRMFAEVIGGEVHVPSGEMPGAGDWIIRWPRYVVPGFGAVRIVGEPGNATVVTDPVDAQAEFERYTPGGVVEIDPEDVISTLPVEPYEILPEEAGLLQLLERGAITMNRLGQYVVHEKIRIPADIDDNFLLLRGVPLPEGSPGRSHFISEETGEEIDLYKR